jgi:Predicted transcriptional regulator
MDIYKKLPDAEFDVMQAIWESTPPVNTSYLMEKIGNKKSWKAPTLISFLVRLEERGFISSEKKGKERQYTPVAVRDDYIRAVTEQFIAQYHEGSFVKMMESLYRDKKLSGRDIDDLLEWLKRTKY